mmetsp:Transcript_106593/g.301572  ORF Transcript_106593/g.301572 Transcript_106593/m.301572 type:complete len:99 (-) Transcript_106593:74-370(-)
MATASEWSETLHVRFLAARPAPGLPKDIQAELIGEIVDWAAATDSLVTLNAGGEPEFKKHLADLGFRPMEGQDILIHSGERAEEAPGRRRYHMIAREV